MSIIARRPMQCKRKFFSCSNFVDSANTLPGYWKKLEQYEKTVEFVDDDGVEDDVGNLQR